jgi:hypothetical protein
MSMDIIDYFSSLAAAALAEEESSMARKAGQIIARGGSRWLIRVYLGHDHETNKRNYHGHWLDGSYDAI